jgi:alpha-beta hydrolase superfamily lysophospholipase
MPDRLHSLAALSAAAAWTLGLAFSPPSNAAAGPPRHGLDTAAAAVMRLPAPPILRYRARDGAALAYRLFAPVTSGPPAVVAILLHGSAGSSLNMTVLGEALARAGVPAFALDARGQGFSGRRGDIDYIGQQDDDLADFVATARKAYPDARLVLVGHSAGGGFALRVAGEAQGRLFSRFVLLSPVLGRLAPTTRPEAGWAKPDVPRILLLAGLNQIGVTAFNGARAVDFNLPAGAESLGLTRAWSYRMMSNYGPHGQTQVFGRPAYLLDAARAPAPIVVIAGAADEQFYADRYAAAFAGLAWPVRVELAPGVDHMGVVSDPRAVPLIVAAVEG